MNEFGRFYLFVLPAGLGLVGFVEPCSIGSSLLFVKYLEDEGAAEKIKQTALFAASRALFIGLLGIAAVAVGSGFVAFQETAWIVLGALYALLGVLLLAGRAGALMVAVGPGIAKLSGLRGSAGLGVLFGFNIPACAAPLLAAVFSARARRLLDTAAHQAARFPKWSGVILIALGAWSIYFGLFVEVPVA